MSLLFANIDTEKEIPDEAILLFHHGDKYGGKSAFSVASVK